MSNNSTVITYLGDGSTTLFNFPFDYLRKSFVKVLLDGVDTTFTFQSDYTVLLSPAPAAGVVVIIKRLTDRDRLVNFVDGSILRATDLNVGQLQAIHIAAEAIDASGASMILDDEGSYDAGFRRIAALGDPVNPRDAVNKQWAETAMSSQLTQATAAQSAATASQAAAAASASSASTSASTAAASATTSTTAKDASEAAAVVSTDKAASIVGKEITVAADAAAAAASALAAQGSESSVAANASAAATNAASALASKNAAASSEGNALTYKNAAQTSASQASTSASGASSSASAASSSASAASSSATTAATSATLSLGYRDTAKTYRDEALAYRNTADTHKTAAANSATDAANTAAGFAVDIKAWAHFDNTGSIRKHRNVSSVVRNGVGDFTINFTTKIPGPTYDQIGVFGACKVSYNAGAGRGTVSVADVAYASAYLGDTSGCTGVRVQAYNSTGSPVDAVSIMVQVLG